MSAPAAQAPLASAASGASGPETLGEAGRFFASRPGPRFLLASCGAALIVRLWLGGWSRWDLTAVAVIAILWPIQEWLIHVFLLHFKPVRVLGRELDFELPRSHRAHHGDPWNLEILFIPLQGFAIAVPLLLLVSVGLMPTVPLAFTVLSAYLLLAIQYEWVHFLVHTRYRPRSRYFRRLWRNHRLHHCKNENYWYGVTMLGGDRLLRTAPVPSSVPLSPTCRTLLAEESTTTSVAA